MNCFTLAYLEQLVIWLVVIVAAVAIFRLVIPWLMGLIGSPPGGGMIVTALGYVVWAVIAVVVVVFAFDLLSCAFGGLRLR